MKAYITKYALTKGVTPMEGEGSEESPTMFVPKTEPGTYMVYFHKPDWHMTWAEAKARAEQMRFDKLASLEKQSRKIAALVFTEPKEAAE